MEEDYSENCVPLPETHIDTPEELKKQNESEVLSDDSPKPETPQKSTTPVEWLEDVARRAKNNNFIELDYLCWLMAEEEDYSEAMDLLWKHYTLDRRGPKTPAVSTFHDRVGSWFALLYRWVGISIYGARADLPAIIYVPVYTFNEKSGEMEKVPDRSSSGVFYVILEEFKTYLANIQSFLNIRLPLPARLFGQDDTVDNIPEKQDEVGRPKKLPEGLDNSFLVPEKVENAMYKYGDFWQLKFKNKTQLFQNYKGLEYIAHLVNNGGEKVHIDQMEKLLFEPPSSDEGWAEMPGEIHEMSEDQLERQGLARKIPSNDKLSVEEAKRLTDTLQGIYDDFINASQKQSNHPQNIDKAKSNWEKTKRHISNEYGFQIFISKNNEIWFKNITIKSKKSRSRRTAIQKGIKAMMKRFKTDFPELYDHLNGHIQTGEYCSYNLAPEKITWDIKP